MALTKDEIKKIASLARINLTPEEETRHAETISAVLGYVELLNEIDTDKVEPTFQVTGLHGIVREDVAEVSINKKELMELMPKVKAGLLDVPGVFKNEDNLH
jgi:aspartyl-tRNA(Asn)/glutamyl-tRNA(Gln) amidotransferase subunit C